MTATGNGDRATTDTRIARDAKNALEIPHSMIYFAPEIEEVLGTLGLSGGRMCYFASRAAPMGRVGAGVVSATFYNFNPSMVGEFIPKAWSIAEPGTVVSARFDAVDKAMRRMLGDEVISSESVSEAATLASEAAETCPPDGKPLFAGHADLTWPEQPHMRLWHALSLLREFRGDAHIAALQQAGLSGLNAVVLQCHTGKGMNETTLKATRGWSDEQWTRTRDELVERGLLDTAGSVTERGERLLEEIEAATDAASMAPWRSLGPERTGKLMEHGTALSRQLLKAGAIPREIFQG